VTEKREIARGEGKKLVSVLPRRRKDGYPSSKEKLGAFAVSNTGESKNDRGRKPPLGDGKKRI